ncbi:MAG TPA: efflux RND transporter periplasmic adaptor subunit [Burkholderiales bacterium]|nr:efflux RND transporter periplasmic adaptor subunit [Burkholderiales bacterium]
MRNIFRYKTTFIVLALLMASAGGLYAWRASTGNAPVYREAIAKRGDIENAVLATGVVQPRNRLEIRPPIPGRIDEILVREGEHVRRGQVLAWMSSSERAALLDAARAKGPEELKRWEELYRATPVIAPLDGMIIVRKAEPGQTFQTQSEDPMLVMSDRLVVRASVDETDIAQVRVRQPARVTLDAYPNEIMQGVVGQVAFDAKTVSNVTTYPVDVLPQRVPSFMRSGMTANVAFILSTRRNVILLPVEALRQDGKGTHVLVPNAQEKNGPPIERKLEIGVNDGQHVEVLSGLAEGETVLIAHVEIKRSPKSTTPRGLPSGSRH